jgi:hypothetical protein
MIMAKQLILLYYGSCVIIAPMTHPQKTLSRQIIHDIFYLLCFKPVSMYI